MADARSLRWWVLSGLGLSILTVVALAAGYQAQGGAALGAELRRLDLRFLVLAIALHILAHLAWALRQWVLARGMRWRLGFIQSWKIITAGVFGAAVTPARVGGDGLRLAMLQHNSPSPGQPAQIILSDRTLDLLYFVGVGIAAALAVPVLFGEQAAWVQSLAFTGVVVLALALLLIVLLVSSRGLVRLALRPGAMFVRWVAPKRGQAIVARGDRLLDDIRDGLLALLREKPFWLVLGAVLTAATWMFEFAILYVLLLGFGHSVSFVPVILAALLLNIIMTLPLTPGGSGIAEIAALALYSAIAPGVSPVFVLVWRAVTYYYDLAVGGVVALRSAAGWLSSRGEDATPRDL